MGESKEPEILERGQWSGKLDFLLSCLGYAVGLGNVWRFPYQCYKYGGGAFLIPYTIMLLFIGIPCFFLEIAIGQYTAMGPVTIYKNLSPLFKGLGIANFGASCFVGLYYNMIIAWTIYYFFASFTSQLPWDGCNNDFNSEFCFNINGYKDCVEQRSNATIPAESVYFLGRCLTNETEWETLRDNISHYYKCGDDQVYINERDCSSLDDFPEENGNYKLFDIPIGLRKSAAAEYYTLNMLNESSGIEDMGPVQWKLCLCLLFAWLIIFLCLIKGIKSSGKVVYFTATYPYFVLVILLIKAATLPGAYEGIKFYMVPDWSHLSNIKVWEAAAVQIFFSLSVAGGGLITLASYNPFKNNVLRDTMIVCFGNCLTSVFAGFAIFSVLGFMATELGVEVKDVAGDGGSGLAFIAYPDLVTRFGASAPFWSILFFSMLFTLGLDSQFAITETILTGIMDFEPRLRSKKTYIVGIISVIGFICGLPLTTRGGGYLLDLLDYYAASWPYLFIGLCELIIIVHIYGLDNFFDDVYSMAKFNMGPWTKTNVSFIYMTLAPALIGVILIISWSNYVPITKGSYQYPGWANGIGWLIAMTLICAVPVVAIYTFGKALYDESKKASFDLMKDAPRILRELTQHTKDWRTNAYSALSVIDNQNNVAETGVDNPGATIEKE